MYKLGVSSCFLYPEKQRPYFGPKTLCYLEADMARYLTTPETLPILIPDLQGEQLTQFLEQMDGFVFQGGADLSPASYGEEPIADGRWPGDWVRDQYELKIMDWAICHHKPVMGICRGMQLLNVYFGGSLYQDTVTQNPTATVHRDAELYDHLWHSVKLKEGSWLAEAYDHEQHANINSVHHQAVKQLGEGLEVLAVAEEDGIVEAIGHQGYADGKVFGVQWHPEFMATTLVKQGLAPSVLIRKFIQSFSK